MPIVVLGLSHNTAPPEVRNRHAFPSERVAEALAALRDYTGVREAAIVATCNRLELYADVDDYEIGVGQLKHFLTTYRSMRVDDFDKYLYTLLGAQAVEQLCRVACGLDSMLIGEEQIVGQVKEALALAMRAHTAGPNLNRLFRSALACGKRARTETGIGRDAVSLGAAAVELASRHCDLSSARVAIVGAGKMGTIVAKHAAARGAASPAIANRTVARARALAASVRGTAHGIYELPQLLRVADLIISATGGGTFLITESMVRAACASRTRPLLILDIAVPRDVQPSAASVDGVIVYELNDLQEVIDAALDTRRSEIPAVEAIIADVVRDYMRWHKSRAAVPLIASLWRKAELIRLAEIGKLFARLPELDDHQRSLIADASVSILNKLLHAPVTRLRETAAETSGLPSDTSEQLLDLDALGARLKEQLAAALRPPPPRTRG